MDQGAMWRGRRLHFVGIGGCGMSGLALVSHALGASVTGSDRSEGPFLGRLRERGIPVSIGHAVENVPPDAEIIHSSAVREDNVERRHGRRMGLREFRRGELLAEAASLRRCIAVAGTHGKTTTAAMTVHALQGAGFSPGYVIGADLISSASNAEWTESEWLVVETDESDRSLLALAPEVAVLTNSELEHVRTYGSREDVDEVFRAFLAQARHAVVWDRPDVRALGNGREVPFDAARVSLEPGGSRFRWGGLDVALTVPGEHNARNAAAALEACRVAGADAPSAAAALAGFQGTRHRFELVGRTSTGASVYDDCAHHPTEVRATLAAARTLAPSRLVAVLHPYSLARVRALAAEFGAALALADVAVVLEIRPGQTESPADYPGVSGAQIAQAAGAAAGGSEPVWTAEAASAERYLRSELRSGDLCVTLGFGEMQELSRRLVDRSADSG